MPETKIAKFAKFNTDLDVAAHNEPPHLDLHCLPPSFWILNMIQLGFIIFWKFADENFVVCFLVVKELRANWLTNTYKVHWAMRVVDNYGKFCTQTALHSINWHNDTCKTHRPMMPKIKFVSWMKFPSSLGSEDGMSNKQNL